MQMNGNEQIPVSPISAPLTDRDSFALSADVSKNSSEPISFRSRFLESFELARLRVSKSANSAKYFEEICKQRVHQELSKCSDPRLSLDNSLSEILSGDSPISSIIDVFRLNQTKRARLSQQFVDDVGNEVLKPLSTLLAEQEARFARLEKDGLTLVSRLKQEYKAHDDSLINFDRSQRKAYESISRTSNSSSPEVRRDLAELCYSSLACERRYHEAVLHVNQTRKEYVKSMEVILDELETIERTRIAFLRDCMDKMFIYELSLCRGTQYELECGFKEIEQSHSAIGAEVDNFIESVRPTNGAKTTVKIISARDIVQPATVVNFSENLELQSVERKIIERIWTVSSDPVELRIDELEALSEIFTTHSGRLSFCKALALQTAEIPSQLSAENLGKILNAILTASEYDMDSECGRRVASFALKFYFHDHSTSRKRYMQSEVYHHSLWNRIQFWEEALLLTVSDFFINQYIERIEGAVDSAGISIDRFGTFLMVFGISVQSALEISRRVMDREDFDFLEDDVRASIRTRIENGIKAAHEKQERNASLLQLSVNSSKPDSPSL